MGKSRYKIFDDRYPYFLTCTIVDWIPLFSSPQIAGIVIRSLRFLQERRDVIIYAFVIMENHIHLICSSPELAIKLARFKSFTARKTIDYLQEARFRKVLYLLAQAKVRHKKDREYQVWQEGSHPQMIMDEKMMIQKIEYIHNNPVKRGYVDEPTHWRFSSARNYAGMEGILEVTTEW